MFRLFAIPALLFAFVLMFASDAKAQCRRTTNGFGGGYGAVQNFGNFGAGSGASCYDDVVEIRQFRRVAQPSAVFLPAYGGNFGNGNFGNGGYAYGGNNFGGGFRGGFGGGGGFRGGFGGGGGFRGAGGGGGDLISNTIRAIGDVANSPAGSFALGAFTGAGGFGRR